jgi:dCMP deaminase
MTDWDHRFMSLAQHIGDWSKDRSRRVGCVVVAADNTVRALGYNGFPRGFDDERDDRHERPMKYRWTEHAERNAIYSAARAGIPVAGCRMYLPWFPCVDCARAIIQAGISELVAMLPDTNDSMWGEDFAIAKEMLNESHVIVRFLDKE